LQLSFTKGLKFLWVDIITVTTGSPSLARGCQWRHRFKLWVETSN